MSSNGKSFEASMEEKAQLVRGRVWLCLEGLSVNDVGLLCGLGLEIVGGEDDNSFEDEAQARARARVRVLLRGVFKPLLVDILR